MTTFPYLRELELHHAARCAELEHILFPQDTPWSEDIFADSIRAPHTFFFGAFLPYEDAATSAGEERLVGYAGIGMMGPAHSPEFEIHSIGTDPAFQRRGIGSLLMDNIVHIADLKEAPVFLEVRTDNVPAIAMYEKYGFVTLGVRKDYYPGADAYTMKREARSPEMLNTEKLQSEKKS